MVSIGMAAAMGQLAMAKEGKRGQKRAKEGKRGQKRAKAKAMGNGKSS